MGCERLQLNERFFFIDCSTTLSYSKTGQLLSIEKSSTTHRRSTSYDGRTNDANTTDLTDTTDNKNNGTTSSSFQRQLKPRTHSPASIRSIRTIRG